VVELPDNDLTFGVNGGSGRCDFNRASCLPLIGRCEVFDLMFADFRNTSLDPRLIAPDRRDHRTGVVAFERQAVAAMEHKPNIGPRGADCVEPLIKVIDHPQRVGSNGQI
jgi:hypothetical protein